MNAAINFRDVCINERLSAFRYGRLLLYDVGGVYRGI